MTIDPIPIFTDDELEELTAPEQLDQFNFKSDARRLGRKFRDHELEDTREVHDFITHYASLLLDDIIEFEGKITTTQHSEKVIIMNPPERNPVYSRSVILDLRRALGSINHKREYVNQFRNHLAMYIGEIVRNAVEVEEWNRTRTDEDADSVECR